MASLLSATAIDARIAGLEQWKRSGKAIEREYKFADFLEAIKFVNAIAEEAEAMDHHPDIDIRYRRVRLSLSTHSAGGLTELDFEMAGRADGAAQALGQQKA